MTASEKELPPHSSVSIEALITAAEAGQIEELILAGLFLNDEIGDIAVLPQRV